MSGPDNQAAETAQDEDVEIVIEGDEPEPEKQTQAEAKPESDPTVADGDEDDDEPEAASADETPEQRARREDRRRRRLNKRQRDAEERAQLREKAAKVDALEARLAEIEGRVTQTVTERQTEQQRAALAYHQDQVNRAVNFYRDAVDRIKKATAEGDGEALAKALDDRDHAIRVHAESAGFIEKAKEAPAPRVEQPRQQARTVPEAQKKHVEAFLSANSWYDPQHRDEDSRALAALDNALAARGSDPSTEKHWQELTRLAKAALPHRFVESERPARQASRPAPSIVGGSGRDVASPKPKYVVSQDRINALIEAGQIDGPRDPRLKDWVPHFMAYDRNQQTA